MDAGVATSAVLAVTTQHMCGMGGDLFALVHQPGWAAPAGLNASGRSGSGANSERLRDEGHVRMPQSGDPRVVPIPGCVDGWLTLHGRFGRLPLSDVLAPAIEYAREGFPASPLLVISAATVAHLPGGADFAGLTEPGAIVRRPGVARALEAIVADGRDGFYFGEFGRGLLELGDGEYTKEDLERSQADWIQPLGIEVWGHSVWTVPPNSQGYLTLAGARIAAGLPLPSDPLDPLWAHFTVESSRQAAFDRIEVLHEHADGGALTAEKRLAPRRDAISAERAATLGDVYRPGGTIYLCAVDSDRWGVSLIQSNATGFGANLAEPSTGIFLHNRGIGFNLTAGHPAEYGPGKRPPHTLSPALVTGHDGELRMVVGTMGGDAQPQILLQLLTRLLFHGEAAGDAVAAPRWVLQAADDSEAFGTWSQRGQVQVAIEPEAPEAWRSGLEARGHLVRVGRGNYGHAHVIACREGHLEGASDPRSLAGEAAGY